MIERVFPAQKVGIESQKERKAGAGQTLTALGSYWKGRKPLVLVRATVLASLLPATNDPVADLEVFEALMAMDKVALTRRRPKVTASMVWNCLDVSAQWKAEHLVPAERDEEDEGDVEQLVGGAAKWKGMDLTHLSPADRRAEKLRIKAERATAQETAFRSLTFAQQVGISERVEKLEDLASEDDPLYAGIWDRVNAHLGTAARSLPGLIEQLGIARFGRRPVVGDPFCGGGSIPFEASRVGCDVVASDLNPVAAMLTWGALNIIGAGETERARISEEQKRVAREVDEEITRLGIEHNRDGDRAKAYLYCLETIDPQTGWLVPMAPSWVISRNRRCAARLVPNYERKRFDIIVEEGVTSAALTAAELGTVRDGHLTYSLSPVNGGEIRDWRIAINRLRGDGEGHIQADGSRANRLRQWELEDFEPRRPTWNPDLPPTLPGSAPGAWVGGDIWQERLYCIQWMKCEGSNPIRVQPLTFFAAPDVDDLARENKVAALVRDSLADWQEQGFVSETRIELGAETTRLMRERGWTHWHHLFGARHLLSNASIGRSSNGLRELYYSRCQTLTLSSRMNNINGTAGQGGAIKYGDVFANNALNTFLNYGVRSAAFLLSSGTTDWPSYSLHGHTAVNCMPANDTNSPASIWIYDPPYADAVNYHEITEFFIVWLRKNPPHPFSDWTWDSRRPLAIQGKGEKFRADMVAAFTTMANHMPDNGLQVCMFTHKDAGVWADMAGIVWASGLRVTAAWYVSTETTSELKQGGYVQGTVLLVMRKRVDDEHGYRSDIVPEVRARVAQQVETLTGLNQRAKGNDRDENLFSDADIQMAGYAAALETLTAYTRIDGADMTREALRPRPALQRGQPVQVGIVEEMIALAVQTANERMLPDGLAEGLWERLGAAERFYLKMTTSEAAWPPGVAGGKLDDYQNFAKAYRAEGWEDLMADRQPNRARLKSATEFRSAYMNGHSVSSGSLRPTLYAVMCLKRDADAEIAADDSGKQVMHGLRDHFGDAEWLRERDNVRTLSTWLGRTWERRNPAEATAARVLASLISSERL